MEFRRRRRRSRVIRSRRRHEDSGAGGIIIIALILVAGTIYVATKSSAGDWIAENVIEPVTALFGGKSEEDSEPSESVSTVSAVSDAPLDLSESGSEAVSASVALPSYECYMLQMGAFSSASNADAAAQSLQSRGAGGYILEDSSGAETIYRVMAAGYADEASARSVKENLAESGTDSAIYTLRVPSVEFKVTADETAFPGIRAGFESLTEAGLDMTDAAISFDRDGLTVAEGKQRASDILTSLESDMSELLASGGDGGALSMILETYSNIKTSVSSLIDGNYESSVAFSAAMKYTQLYITNQYATLVSGLAG